MCPGVVNTEVMAEAMAVDKIDHPHFLDEDGEAAVSGAMMPNLERSMPC